MSEIEELYKNCGITIKNETFCTWDSTCPYSDLNCEDCGYSEVDENTISPAFSIDKQLNLIKWMVKTSHKYFVYELSSTNFEESLAKVFNLYWTDLTLDEQKEIKSIIEK